MPQRVTNSMLIHNYNRNLNNNTRKMMKFQEQLATERRISRLSDDPVGIVKALNARAKRSDIAQFKRNINDALSSLEQTESTLDDFNSVIKRVYELAVKTANGVNDKQELKATAQEIRELMDHILMLGNASLSDRFILGGFNITSAPFRLDENINVRDISSPYLLNPDYDPDYDPTLHFPPDLNKSSPFLNDPAYDPDLPTDWSVSPPVNPQFMLNPDYDPDSIHYDARYDNSSTQYNERFATQPPYTKNVILFNGIDMTDVYNSDGSINISKMEAIQQLNPAIEFEVGFNLRIEVTLRGADVMGIGSQNNIYSVLQDFYTDLMKGNTDDIQSYIGKMQKLQDNVLAQMATIGGRVNRLDMLTGRYNQEEINYSQMQSDAEDIDLAKTIMHFSMAEAIYRAALSVGGRILQPTLLDFLR
jgi:flagellar hook-associated protein 3 FlgL